MIFLMVYLTQALSEFKCSNICIKSDDSFSKTPSALIERLMNLTGRNFFFCSTIISLYFEYLRCILFLRLVSYPTVSSSTYRRLSLVKISRSGRKSSPVITEGLGNDGKSA